VVQKRFLPDGGGKYFLLKLHPKVTKLPKGRSWTETSCNQWGPPRCFYENVSFAKTRSRPERDLERPGDDLGFGI
jgi:hypothetical protein